jgi:hypothetical protein
MSNSKISALTGATTPLAGTEVLPIVQSSTTKQVSVANLTAGRAISATSVTASTGNFVVGTSGQGVDFSATPGTGTSELFADYEEGTWTPTWTGSTGNPTVTYTGQNGYYTKVGNVVTVQFWLEISVTVGGSGDLQLSGLPFTSKNSANATAAGSVGFNNSVAKLVTPQIAANVTYMNFIDQSILGSTGAVPVSALINGASKYFMGSITYLV